MMRLIWCFSTVTLWLMRLLIQWVINNLLLLLVPPCLLILNIPNCLIFYQIQINHSRSLNRQLTLTASKLSPLSNLKSFTFLVMAIVMNRISSFTFNLRNTVMVKMEQQTISMNQTCSTYLVLQVTKIMGFSLHLFQRAIQKKQEMCCLIVVCPLQLQSTLNLKSQMKSVFCSQDSFICYCYRAKQSMMHLRKHKVHVEREKLNVNLVVAITSIHLHANGRNTLKRTVMKRHMNCIQVFVPVDLVIIPIKTIVQLMLISNNSCQRGRMVLKNKRKRHP